MVEKALVKGAENNKGEIPYFCILEGKQPMNNPQVETNERLPQQWRSEANAYSARVQEAMRYDRLRSSDYPLVMAILHAVSQGYTEATWKEEQQRRRKIFLQPSSEKEIPPADTDSDYEQLVLRLKALMLWPW